MKRGNLAIFAVGCGLCQQLGDCRASEQPQHEVNHVPHRPCVSRFKTHVQKMLENNTAWCLALKRPAGFAIYGLASGATADST